MIKQIDQTKVHVEFQTKRLVFNYYEHQSENNNQNIHYELILDLNGEIKPSESNWKVTSVKAEIKLRKVANYRWEKLEASPCNKPIITGVPMNSLSQASELKSSSNDNAKTKGMMRNWDELVKQVEKEDEQEEGGVEDLFRRIYSTGDENLRRAMNKSFVESNGTVLSTNWNDVGKGKVDVKPPDSCEYRKWNE
ncbi:suppressor of G2 allele of SKP1-like protein [Euroglyphus maynei]|uniref:Suppressor of G2 allele of SKP1-like protein n=1 Tax=Euroglyphus maynei TaxID=6958 RepID=A0A1Y3BQF3_EURMA|nr:suppressor of G2 allele of SKP1-like protein [Euroglyphus maynei]